VKTNFITSHLFKGTPDHQNYDLEVTNNIVKRMDTMLHTPEFFICHQDEELITSNDDIYFIAKGKCNVLIRDKFGDRQEQKMIRVLEPGMHFGEISMLY
jgi:CRP-like cAMP-binding protein